MPDLGRLSSLVVGTTFVVLVLPTVLSFLAIAYAVLRVRDNGSEEHDPQIGIKAALHFFHSLFLLMMLMGLTIISVDVLTKEDWGVQSARGGPNHPLFTPAQRNGIALTFTGLVGSLLHLVLLVSFTNDRRWSAARRTFMGARFAVHGLVVMTCVTALVLILVQDNVEIQNPKALLAIMVVWVPSWIIHLVLLILYSKQPYVRAKRILTALPYELE